MKLLGKTVTMVRATVMRRLILLLSGVVFAIFLIVPCGPLCGEEPVVLHSEDVTVIFEKPLDAPAREVAAIYPHVKGELEQLIGWELHYPPRVLLIKKRETFQKMIGSDLFVAIAVPRERLIVVDYSRMTTRPFTLRTTLKHELCHLLLHHHIERGRLPRWLNEGIAQWASDGFAEIIMKRDRFILPRAVLTGRYIPLQALEEYFPRRDKALLLAYEESKSIVEYIIETFGKDGLLRILEQLKRGDDMEDAVSKSLAVSVYELEDRWHTHLKGRISWFAFVSKYLYEILFFLAALLSIWGFIKLLRKRMAYNSHEEPDEDDYSTGSG